LTVLTTAASPTPLQRGMLSAAMPYAGASHRFFFAQHGSPSLRCAAGVLRRLCALTTSQAPGCVLQSPHPCSCTSARKLSSYRKRHFVGAFNQHHRQSVLLRVHTSPLSAASALTALRVSGKWPWPPLWPANQPFGAQSAGMRTANHSRGPGWQEISLPASWEWDPPQ